MPDGKHYKQYGPTQHAALTMDIDKLKKLYDQRNQLKESHVNTMDSCIKQLANVVKEQCK